MGDPSAPPGLPPEKLDAYRRQLEELEILGVSTDELKRVLAEQPEDFERAAAELFRREFQPDSAEPVAPPSAEPQAPPVVPPEDAQPPDIAIETPGTVAPVSPPTGDPMLPEHEPQAEPVAPAPPSESDSMAFIERELAAAALPLDVAPEAPAPSALEETALGAQGPDDSMERDIEEAMGSPQPASDEAPPPLASGDSLSVGAARPASRPAPAGPTASKKPPPPRSEFSREAAVPMVPQRVTTVRIKSPPPGATPAAAGGGESAGEVFPVEEAPKRRWAPAAVGALLLIGVFAGVFLYFGNGAPTAVFGISPSSPEAGQTIFFDAANSSDPNGDPLVYHWNFGDTTANATGVTATHQYPHSGTYEVTLAVSDPKKATATKTQSIAVLPGHIDVPVYRYADRADYTVAGTSDVEGTLGQALTTFRVGIGGAERDCDVTAVNATYTGTQYRQVEAGPTPAKNGFLDENQTYALDRHLVVFPNGDIDNTCQILHFAGNSTAHQQDFQNLASNDTVRSETDAHTKVTITNAQPTKTLESRAHLIDYPRLSTVSDQLHLEEVYAGRSFDTEATVGGNFSAEGYTWSWITQGTSLVGGHLAIKLNFTIPQRPVTITQLYLCVWVSSASSFPLREEFFVHGIEPGKQYESFFASTLSGTPTQGTDTIPFGNTTATYPTISPGTAVALAEVPRAAAGADFAFTPQQAFDEAYANLTDFRNFMAANSQAYATNATYGRNAGNPKWTVDFAQDALGEKMRVEDEHSGSTLVFTSAGQRAAEKTRAQIGNVVTLNYALAMLESEQQGSRLFASGAFDAAHANFTVRTELKLPTLSLSAVAAATRAPVPYAFGAESLDSESQRVTAYVDAQTGQFVFSVLSSGDSLP